MKDSENNGTLKPKHADCAWLLPENGSFVCCDIRSPNHGKKMDIEECKKDSCNFFHEKKKRGETKKSNITTSDLP